MDSNTHDTRDIISQQNSHQSGDRVQEFNFNKDEERIGSLIKKGYRVMILMRGPPGVGKSYLARLFVTNFVDIENLNYNVRDFVCSSDDYFYDTKGFYKYNPTFIPHAHEFNHQRVKGKAESGLSPIIVDNTNMQLWEMLPYVKYAVQNNYLIEIVEPKTPWNKSSSALAQKNTHGVSQKRIQQIMEKYENGSVSTLMRMLKNTKYSKILPQRRSLPPINTSSINTPTLEPADNITTEETSKEGRYLWNEIAPTVSKEQRSKFKLSGSPSKLHEDSTALSTRNVYSLLEKKTTNVWRPIESESADFWETTPSVPQKQQFPQQNQKSLLDLLREDSGEDAKDLKPTQQYDAYGAKVLGTLERHSVGCPNEETAFVTLRQIYSNKRISDLWDLFVKCNGDVDWAVDILLKENELEGIQNDDDIGYRPDDEFFECLCGNVNRVTKNTPCQHESNADINYICEATDTILNLADSKQQRQRTRISRSKQCTNDNLLEIKENIENCFVLGDDQYSEHLRKIRNIRSGINEVPYSSNDIPEGFENVEQQFTKNENSDGIAENEADKEDNETEDSNEEMLEMALGEQLIQQLVDTFRNESSLEEQIPSNLPDNLKVFMPRSLAKQLYVLWVESALNYMEEERQNGVREDEDFARLLKNPKYSELKQSPSNLHEILDMEYAWKVYNQDMDEQKQRDIEMEKQHVPTDLATHLTQLKLCELFPDIPRETLVDMLVTNGNDYHTTVADLRSTMQMDNISTTQEHLMKCARQEQQLVDQQVQNQKYLRQERSKNWSDGEQKCTLSPDEVKRLALREFEESRNLAAHHCQLKAECYQKAKEAIQSGNGGVSFYYSQIARLHIKKIDMYNHRAANCIMEVHKNTQNNPDLLDLHYLYLIEALGCLDLFLDRHITGLRLESRNYKHVFIITGRGKHSAGGVSTIKNKVKARLKERCLRWSEINPGLLKVKIFSGSRHSKNI